MRIAFSVSGLSECGIRILMVLPCVAKFARSVSWSSGDSVISQESASQTWRNSFRTRSRSCSVGIAVGIFQELGTGSCSFRSWRYGSIYFKVVADTAVGDARLTVGGLKRGVAAEK